MLSGRVGALAVNTLLFAPLPQQIESLPLLPHLSPMLLGLIKLASTAVGLASGQLPLLLSGLRLGGSLLPLARQKHSTVSRFTLLQPRISTQRPLASQLLSSLGALDRGFPLPVCGGQCSSTRVAPPFHLA